MSPALGIFYFYISAPRLRHSFYILFVPVVRVYLVQKFEIDSAKMLVYTFITLREHMESDIPLVAKVFVFGDVSLSLFAGHVVPD
jgi:hypothetical protein